MRIARFLWRNRVRWGAIEGDRVRAVRIGGDNSPSVGKFLCSLAEARLLAPIDPYRNKVAAIAANYGERDDRDGPGIFMKQSGTVVGPDDPIIYPRTGLSIIHEAELGVVIGRAAKNVPVDEADDYVLGYTCINDVSGSRFTADDTGHGTSMRWKHFDTFCPVGPWIDTDLEPGSGARPPSESSAPRSSDPRRRIQCRVNGETVVDGSTDDMLWNVAQLVSWVSEAMTLYPGDIIATGCPGVGEINVGDTVEIEVEGVGTLRNFVVADPAPPTADWPALIR